MSLLAKIKHATRGGVGPTTVIREVIRRSRASQESRRERQTLDHVNQAPPHLRTKHTAEQLSAHFRSDRKATFLAGFVEPSVGDLQRTLFPSQTTDLERLASGIVTTHSWNLLGFGEQCFGGHIEWCRDPLSAYLWPLEYHRDINLQRTDGSDIRVLWELNRLGHLLTLARAYAVTPDEQLAQEFFLQVQSWTSQNPYGRGPNWTCAMEVALRAINLLGAFEIFRRSPQLNDQSLTVLLRLFQQHGTYIKNNLEFSYLATSNHYFSDVVGLLWLGLMLPELTGSESWTNFGLVQMMREIDKQILEDGADFESSTGYHRFVLELLLYSFILCRQNSIEIDDRYSRKLHAMLLYTRSYLRPDGMAPLLGDTDSGQVLPLKRRRANDHSYLLAIGAVLFDDPKLKLEGVEPPEELLWTLGPQGIEKFKRMAHCPNISAGYRDAGVYIMRDGDLYLCFNTSSTGLNGRGSHGQNDALSLEISACGQPFVVDPGTFVYTGNLHKRHEFRSTAFHSTVKVDGVEQNTTDESVPFVIGDEAHPRVLRWESSSNLDFVSAEHSGYLRLSKPLVHRRRVTFEKPKRLWQMRDEFIGEGSHEFEVRFHFAPEIEVAIDGEMVIGHHPRSNSRLLVCCSSLPASVEKETQFVSIDYGQSEQSITACFKFSGKVGKLDWLIVPVCTGEGIEERLGLAKTLDS